LGQARLVSLHCHTHGNVECAGRVVVGGFRDLLDFIVSMGTHLLEHTNHLQSSTFGAKGEVLNFG